MVYSMKTKQKLESLEPVAEPVTIPVVEAVEIPPETSTGAVSVQANYMEKPVPPDSVFQGRPKDFEFKTSDSHSRVYGQLIRMDKYGLFIGTAQAQDALSKVKGMGIQLFTAIDMRDTAKMLLELADYAEGKVK
jgi:hypothetical protein